MPEFYSLEKPPKEKVEKLKTELYEYSPELKPRLTFIWPLSESRKEALEMIKSEKIDVEKVSKLLERDDFVEKEAGLYLLKSTKALSATNIEDCKKIFSILENIYSKGEHAETALLWGDITFKAISNLLDKTPSNFLEKMLEDGDFSFLKETALMDKIKIRIIESKREKGLPILDEMIRDVSARNSQTRRSAIEAKVKIINELHGEKALPILEKMVEEGDQMTNVVIIKSLTNFGEKSLPVLEKILEKCNKFDRYAIREEIVQVLGDFGEEAFPLLDKMARDEHWNVRGAVAEVLANFGQKALPILEKMASVEDEFQIKISIIKSLRNFGDKALAILEKMAQNADFETKKSIALAKAKIIAESQGEEALEKLSQENFEIREAVEIYHT